MMRASSSTAQGALTMGNKRTSTFPTRQESILRPPFTLLLRRVQGREAVFRKGEALFWEGDDPNWLYLIEQGKVILSKALPAENKLKTIVAVCSSGDLVGEVAVLDGRPYDTDAIALTQVTALRIPREAFLYALQNDPALALQVVSNLAARLRQAQEVIRWLSTQRVEKRLAALLLALMGRFGTRTEEGIVLDSSFSRYDLAAMAGTTVETTVRTLSAWAQEGIIKKHRRQIVIVDARKLAQIAREP
jgi:CRP-like cAMP-binding protein